MRCGILSSGEKRRAILFWDCRLESILLVRCRVVELLWGGGRAMSWVLSGYELGGRAMVEL